MNGTQNASGRWLATAGLRLLLLIALALLGLTNPLGEWATKLGQWADSKLNDLSDQDAARDAVHADHD